MIVRGGDAYHARTFFDNKELSDNEEFTSNENNDNTDWPSKPVWCFGRVGDTLTELAFGPTSC